jgi:hypothetical protein
MTPGDPDPTSHAEDAYRRVFANRANSREAASNDR